MINFKNVKFVKSIVDVKEAPTPSFDEVVFVGRSNVGKSSLINALLMQNIANVSKKPGRTATLNYFLLDNNYYLVDAPGYGYSKDDHHNVSKFSNMMEPYFHHESLKLVVFLLDSRREINDLDLDFYNYLQELNLKVIVVFTKLDKLNQKEKALLKKRCKTYLSEATIAYTSILKLDTIKSLKELISSNL